MMLQSYSRGSLCSWPACVTTPISDVGVDRAYDINFRVGLRVCNRAWRWIWVSGIWIRGSRGVQEIFGNRAMVAEI